MQQIQKSAAMETYYSDDDFTRILDSFVMKSSVDVKLFRKKIENCAYIYDIYVEHLPQEPDPSDIKRRIVALRKKTENFLSSADWIAEIAVAEKIMDAADELAKLEGLPDFEPELVPLEAIPPNSPTEGKSWYSAIENKINKMEMGNKRTNFMAFP